MIEAFIAMTLIMIVVNMLLQQESSQKQEISEQVYSKETWMLRGIQLNDTLRTEILGALPPIYWTNETFPSMVKERITEMSPSYLTCRAKICSINSPCSLEEEVDEDVYVQSIFISANATFYSPRELKLFCWEV